MNWLKKILSGYRTFRLITVGFALGMLIPLLDDPVVFVRGVLVFAVIWLLGFNSVKPELKGCAECAKKDGPGYMWALYCTECIQKHGMKELLVYEPTDEQIAEAYRKTPFRAGVPFANAVAFARNVLAIRKNQS